MTWKILGFEFPVSRESLVLNLIEVFWVLRMRFSVGRISKLVFSAVLSEVLSSAVLSEDRLYERFATLSK